MRKTFRLTSLFAGRRWPYVAAVGLAVSLPLCLYGVPYGPDSSHHYRLALGFYEAATGGDPYPSWLHSTNDGYGDPSVRFYPPGLYLLLALARAATREWYCATLLTFALLNVAGGVGAYLWARALGAGRFAVAAAPVYLLAPFHANELYQAALYGQYAGASVLPFVFAFAARLMSRRARPRDVAGLGLSYGLLILFNLPFALLGTIALAAYALVSLIRSFDRAFAPRLLAGVTLGAALSCFYWLAVVREMAWKSPSGEGQGEWFTYSRNFIFQPSPSEMGDWWLTFLLTYTLLVAAPSVVLLRARKRAAAAPAVVALFSFLMATPLSKPVWDALTPLRETQFPWRWLTVTAACVSVLVALALRELARMSKTRLRPLALALAGVSVVGLSFTVTQLIKGSTYRSRAEFNRTVASLRGSETNRDFLPVWAAPAAGDERQRVEAAGRGVEIVEWAAEHRSFRVDAGQQVDARLRTFYYPHWRATVNGREQAAGRDAGGALLVSVPPEASAVEVRFVEPFTTRAAAASSAVALLLVALLAFAGRRRARRPRRNGPPRLPAT